MNATFDNVITDNTFNIASMRNKIEGYYPDQTITCKDDLNRDIIRLPSEVIHDIIKSRIITNVHTKLGKKIIVPRIIQINNNPQNQWQNIQGINGDPYISKNIHKYRRTVELTMEPPSCRCKYSYTLTDGGRAREGAAQRVAQSSKTRSFLIFPRQRLFKHIHWPHTHSIGHTRMALIMLRATHTIIYIVCTSVCLFFFPKPQK